jgi:hypothetical protein
LRLFVSEEKEFEMRSEVAEVWGNHAVRKIYRCLCCGFRGGDPFCGVLDGGLDAGIPGRSSGCGRQKDDEGDRAQMEKSGQGHKM